MAAAANQQNYYDLYRHGSLGVAMTDALDDLIGTGAIDPQLAMKVLTQFDRIVAESLNERVKARLSFKGSLDTYRFCDDVWTFLIKNVTFKSGRCLLYSPEGRDAGHALCAIPIPRAPTDEATVEGGAQTVAEKIKIVSCSSKRNDEK